MTESSTSRPASRMTTHDSSDITVHQTNRNQTCQLPRGWLPLANEPPKKTFVTVLITDSIMRHIPDNALGMNHQLHILHKTDTTGLEERRVRFDTLEGIKPDFIYVHLGINDLFKRKTFKEVTANYAEFSLFVDEKLPNSKLIFSLPLLTDRPEECNVIQNLHSITMDWIVAGDGNPNTRRCHFNTNNNLMKNNWTQKESCFASDGIHLTAEGKEAILKNFRFKTHALTRQAQLTRRFSIR